MARKIAVCDGCGLHVPHWVNWLAEGLRLCHRCDAARAELVDPLPACRLRHVCAACGDCSRPIAIWSTRTAWPMCDRRAAIPTTYRQVPLCHRCWEGDVPYDDGAGRVTVSEAAR